MEVRVAGQNEAAKTGTIYIFWWRAGRGLRGEAMVELPISRHLDPGSEAGHGFVHHIVEHLGGEMVEGAAVDAAEIHSQAAADRLQPLQHLDRMGIVIGGRGGGGREQI